LSGTAPLRVLIGIVLQNASPHTRSACVDKRVFFTAQFPSTLAPISWDEKAVHSGPVISMMA
jgi:hypothetical protein